QNVQQAGAAAPAPGATPAAGPNAQQSPAPGPQSKLPDMRKQVGVKAQFMQPGAVKPQGWDSTVSVGQAAQMMAAFLNGESFNLNGSPVKFQSLNILNPQTGASISGKEPKQ